MPAADVERLSRRSGFVFAGRVLRTGATTTRLIEPSKETAVVKVDRVLRAPADLGAERGSEVTVRVRSRVRKGQRAVFFTVGWISAEGLAVQEIGRQPATELGKMNEQMAEAARKQERAAMRKRVREAHAVVVGRVAETRPVGRAPQPPASEHDPQWRTAVVVVERGEKGDVKEGQRIRVAYASSRDVMWFEAPKPVQDDRAVFLLHRRELAEVQVELFAILEPIDMQPVERLDEIREVM